MNHIGKKVYFTNFRKKKLQYTLLYGLQMICRTVNVLSSDAINFQVF